MAGLRLHSPRFERASPADRRALNIGSVATDRVQRSHSGKYRTAVADNLGADLYQPVARRRGHRALIYGRPGRQTGHREGPAAPPTYPGSSWDTSISTAVSSRQHSVSCLSGTLRRPGCGYNRKPGIAVQCILRLHACARRGLAGAEPAERCLGAGGLLPAPGRYQLTEARFREAGANQRLLLKNSPYLLRSSLSGRSVHAIRSTSMSIPRLR